MSQALKLPTIRYQICDLVALFVGSDSHVGDIWNGYVLGKAQMPGRLSISTVTNNFTFAHEIGHNAGGLHCMRSQPGYKNGYEQGVQCSDREFWYSGMIGWEPGMQLRGSWADADMSRTWLEQKYRLASYAPPYPPQPEFYELAPENFKGVPGPGRIQFSWDPVPNAIRYDVIKRFGIPPTVGSTENSSFLLEGRQATSGTYSVEGVDAQGNLSKRSVYLQIEVSP
ncbi:hypothetical protein PMI35_01989 [Pseudomonas sp. GM78]|uniref:hypothetical protein n=1 Tax=Pseudomonas sp. GM78 TaxID=1144337 RepID=UPI000270B1AF|nr:hypothetical protein [Pseudomonas sp. GM78]EJN30420.1 hypothetical protein PMI35_01989 [Pseudomonas sp. GM78]